MVDNINTRAVNSVSAIAFKKVQGGGVTFSDQPSPVLHFTTELPSPITLLFVGLPLTYFLWFSPLFFNTEIQGIYFFSDPPSALYNYRLDPPYIKKVFPPVSF